MSSITVESPFLASDSCRPKSSTASARGYLPFAMQRISVAAHLAMAQEVAEALGLSVAADPRAC